MIWKRIKALFVLIPLAIIGIRVVDEIKREERIKKKCKEGTLTIWDLI